MGIPSYFSYIIRNYPKIIRNVAFMKNNVQIKHLYMDCNSVIYDTVALLEKLRPKLSLLEFETLLLQKVAEKIDEYILLINPSITIYVAFDGFAPLAKVKQQTGRRYKNTYFSTIKFGGETEDSVSTFNKNEITPGTEFMKKLSAQMKKYYTNSEARYKVEKVIISTPEDFGEGEHKVFQYIRENSPQHVNDDVALYGLDADLIMLSIFHLHHVNNIYIFREAPQFMKSSIPVDISLGGENEPKFLDMSQLAHYILNEMRCKNTNKRRILDYVFMCFFLGNDFLPHFAALNIRTQGINAILDIYRMHIGNYPDRYFICPDTEKILWIHVRTFIYELSKKEHEFLLIEHQHRDKIEKRVFLEKTAKEKEDVFQNVPIIYRAEEKYICPTEPFWEDRYYKVLFFDWKQTDKDNQLETKKEISKICKNYVKGVEWVYKYYTGKLKDVNSYSYEYSMGPLLKDMYKEITMLEESEGEKGGVQELKKIKEGKLEWAYKRYIWESSVKEMVNV